MIRRRGETRERAVSEVISALLMVSVTIVLAAMVGSVLLNVVGNVDDDPLAGASVSFDGDDDEIRVVYTATQENGTSLEIRTLDSDGVELCSKPVPDVGDSIRITPDNCGLSDGNEYTVRVVAKAVDGREAVVLEKDGSI